VSIHYNKQSQFELFPEALRHSADNTRTGFFHTTLTLSLDNIIVFGIVITMMLVASFALGVERGRSARPSVSGRSRPASRAAVPRRGVQPPGARQPAVLAREGSPASGVFAIPVSGKDGAVRDIHSAGSRQTSRDDFSPQMLKSGITISLPKDSLSKPVPARNQEVLVDLNRLEGATGGQEKKVDKIYTVQVASYSSAALAQPALERMEKDGWTAEVLPKGKYFILCIGKYPARKEAETAQKKLMKEFKDCNIRSL